MTRGDELISLVNNIVPLLNGSDGSLETKLFLGPKLMKVHRYLIILYVAKHVQSFSLLGTRKGSSLCFTLYRLARIAQTGFKFPIHYDRSKVAISVYEKSKALGYVEIWRDQGETFISTTRQGDEIIRAVLNELVQFAQIHSSANKEGYVSKGATKFSKTSTLAGRMLYNQLKTIHILNKHFGQDILDLEEHYT